MRLAGLVQNGKLGWDQPAGWTIALREFEGKRVEVEIRGERDKRTLEANSRYWTLLNPLAQECFAQKYNRKLGKYATHSALVLSFAKCETSPLTGEKIQRETKDMSTKEFYEFTSEVEAWLHEEWPESGAFEETA